MATKHEVASVVKDEAVSLMVVTCTCGESWTIAIQDHAEGKDGMDDHRKFGGRKRTRRGS